MLTIAVAFFVVLLPRYSWGLSSDQQCREVIEDFRDLCPWTEESWNGEPFADCASNFTLQVNCTEHEVMWTVLSNTGDKHNAIDLMQQCNSSSDMNKSRLFLASNLDRASTILPKDYTRCIFSACYRIDDGQNYRHTFLMTTSCQHPSLVQATSDKPLPSHDTELTYEQESTSRPNPTSQPLSTVITSPEWKPMNTGQGLPWPYFIITVAIPGASLFVTTVLAVMLAVMICKLLKLRKKQLRNMSIKHGIPISHGLHLPDILVDTAEFSLQRLDPTKSEESLCQSLYAKTVDKLKQEDNIDPENALQIKPIKQIQNSIGDEGPDYFGKKVFIQPKEQFSFGIEPMLLSPSSPDFGNSSTVDDSGYMDTTSTLNRPLSELHNELSEVHNEVSLSFGDISGSTLNNTADSEDLCNLDMDFDWEPVNSTHQSCDDDIRTTMYVTCDQEAVFPVKDLHHNDSVHAGYVENMLSSCNISNAATALEYSSSMLCLDDDHWPNEVLSTKFEAENEIISGYLFDSSHSHCKFQQ